MKAIFVDDERWALDQLTEEAAQVKNLEVGETFQRASNALEYIKANKVEMAVLDIEMPGIDGLTLGKEIRDRNPDAVIVYVTGYNQYVKDAILNVKADFYILKPSSSEEIQDTFKKATLLARHQNKGVSFQMFGPFEMLLDGRPVLFQNSKAKELLALCLHKQGGVVSMEEAVTYLWEDHPYDHRVKSLYRKAVIYLTDLFKNLKIDDIFEKIRGGVFIKKNNVDCDYYRYLDGEMALPNKPYLENYTWAEGENAQLEMSKYESNGNN